MKTSYINRQFLELSHSVTGDTPCTCQDIDIAPQVSFQEGDTRGRFSIAARVDNLVLNAGTHIVFPGHLPAFLRLPTTQVSSKKEYPLGRFIGPVLVIDMSYKIKSIRHYFDDKGKFCIPYHDERQCLEFLLSLDKLEITLQEVCQRLAEMNIQLKEVRGIVFYTGLSAFWAYAKYEAWEYLYFFSPFLQKELCSFLIENNLSFVGIDSFQLEYPVIHLCGQEEPFVLNPACRDYILEKLGTFESVSNHRTLLKGDVLIYQNLRLPASISNETIDFFGAPWNLHLSESVDTLPVRVIAGCTTH